MRERFKEVEVLYIVPASGSNEQKANFYVTVSIKPPRLCQSCTNCEITT
jgi:hypothetical protein